MLEINAQTAAGYLRERGHVGPHEPIDVAELAGGVSNVVLLVTLPERGERLVLKQARGQLRVKEEWLCPVERIWREAEVLRVCAGLLRSAERGTRNEEQPPVVASFFRTGVPSVLWEDRANYCLAMTAALPNSRTWKEMLLRGRTKLSLPIAAAAGRLLGRLHAGSWCDTALSSALADRSYFDLLRLDPYYRHAAKNHPDLAPRLAELVDSVWNHRRCLVHGDYSPKNLLVWPVQLWLIDHEVGHFGDPAFDLGFFLTHLVAKAIHARAACRLYLDLAAMFWREYRAVLAPVVPISELADLKSRMLLNLAGCLLARVDGKSPLEYLDDAERRVIRQLGREWLVSPPERLTESD
ncbi:MAG: phosphotransferase [Planctomycetaceae bacterium]|nr:phosphotransferase [Planctomycetaceae bacterium]